MILLALIGNGFSFLRCIGEVVNMLVLFETSAGFALFKVLDEGKLSKVEVHGFLILCCL